MKLDPTAAAYGLFQIVFADLTEHFVDAVFRLKLPRVDGLKFEQVFRLQFKRLVEDFKEELKQFEGSPLVTEDLREVREACEKAANLSGWRNDRIHTRVRQLSDGFALFDWRTGKRLTMNLQECEEKLVEAAKIIVTLECNIPRLIGEIEWNLDWNKWWEESSETVHGDE